MAREFLARDWGAIFARRSPEIATRSVAEHDSPRKLRQRGMPAAGMANEAGGICPQASAPAPESLDARMASLSSYLKRIGSAMLSRFEDRAPNVAGESTAARGPIHIAPVLAGGHDAAALSAGQPGHASGIRRAIEAGVAFLESAQLPSGEIPIEISPNPEMSGACAREPVVFPAALAARVLSAAAPAWRVRARALDFLVREMAPEGLWRHPSSDKPQHYDTPFDVDDTSLASAAFAAAGRTVPDNRHVLIDNREPDGLFRTWIVRWNPHPLLTRRFFRHTAETRDVDAVVMANVVYYLGACEETRPAIEHMLEVLRTGREMRSTIWYGSRFTVWYFFSHALRRIAPEAGHMIVPRVEDAVPTNALELALATSTLQIWDRTPDVRPLLETQLPSGAWQRAGFYHMGQRRNEPRPNPPWWGSEALTTVFAVEALSRRLSGEDRAIDLNTIRCSP